MAARGRGQPHKLSDEKEPGLPAIGTDFGFVGQDGEGLLPMVVTKEHIRAVRNQAMGAAFGFFDGDVLVGIAKDPEMMEAALRSRGPKSQGG